MALALPTQEVRSILAFACNLLGDSICRLPAIEAAKRAYPESSLAVVSAPDGQAIFEGQGFIDEVWVLNRSGGSLSQSREWLRIAAQARARRPDIVIDLYGSQRTAALSSLCGARVRCGRCQRGQARWYTHKVHDADALERGHLIEQANAVAKAVGIEPEFEYCSLALSQQDSDSADAVIGEMGLSSARPLVLLNPSARVAAKRWPAIRFGQLAQRFGREGAICGVITAPGQDDIATEVVNASDGVAVRLPVLPIKILAALLRRTDLLLTGDTGTLHLGAAMGAPTVVLSGPTEPGFFSHPGLRQTVLHHSDVCSEWTVGRQCARYNECNDLHCIEAIAVDEVEAAMREMLGLG